MKKTSKSTIEEVGLAGTPELVTEWVMTKAWRESLDAQAKAAVDGLSEGAELNKRFREVEVELGRRFPLDSYVGEHLYEEVPSLNPHPPTELEKLEAEAKAAEEAVEAEKDREVAEEKARVQAKKDSEEFLKEQEKAQAAHDKEEAKAAHKK